MTLLAIAISSWYFWAMCICAFIGVISLFQIDSAFADKKKANKWFIIGGILFILLAVFFLYLVQNTAGAPPNIES